MKRVPGTCLALSVSLLAGCGGATTTPDVAATVVGSVREHPSTTASVSASASTTAPARASASPVPAAPAPAPPAPAPTVPRCTSELVTMTAVRSGGAGDETRIQVTVRNKSAASCMVRGWPGVSMVSFAQTQLGREAKWVGESRPMVTLAPGAAAAAQVVVKGGQRPGCEPAVVDKLRIILPGQYDAILMPLEAVTVCRDATASTELTVTAFAPS